MTVLGRLEDSNVWDSRYDLPLSPQNNNPWFYCALALKMIYASGQIPTSDFLDALYLYANKCEIEPGLFRRWPNSSPSDVTSHDELIGMAYLAPSFAHRICSYLDAHDGYYNNTALPEKIPEEWNLYRIYWLPPYLRARARMPVSLLSQLKWSAFVLWDLVKIKKETNDASGRLLIWIMSDDMSGYSLCLPVIKAWRLRMKLLGITPETMLLLEPRENPILSELSPEEF